MSLSRVIIVHGTGGNPDENWFPWLRSELETRGVEVVVPQFSGPDDQGPESWSATLASVTEPLNEETILVGHSIGAAFILHLLETSPSPILGTVLASGFVGKLGNDFDVPNAAFFTHDFDWETIRANAGEVRLFFGDNDPYVSPAAADLLASGLQTDLTFVPQGGHLNTAAGFTTFPALLAEIESLASATRA
jgi:predicted alpha/beta hydrolase family esterase